MEVICPQCKAINRSTAQFCDQCGSPLGHQKSAQPQQPESPVGNAFESSGWQTPSVTPEAPSDPSSDINPRRPSTLPEQQHVQPKQQPQQHEEPQLTPVKPSGVAFESGGGLRNGRPISLPEQQGGKTTEANTPKFSAKGNRVIGEVREFRERRETEGNFTWTIWTFRVERYDESGNRMQPVPVEIKGMKFEGTISEGDWVELPELWKPGEVASPKKFDNLTTGARISGSVPFGTKIGMTCGWIVFVIFIGAVIAFVYFVFLK